MNRHIKPWMMLICRSILFLTFQSLIALGLMSLATPQAWSASEAWWPISVTLTNLICLALLLRFYQQEGRNYWEIFKFQRENIKADLVFLIGFLLIAGPIGYLPNMLSASWLFGNQQAAFDLLVRPLPLWAALTSFIVFPLLQGIVEIPIYTLYVQPHLESQGVRPWLATILVSVFLSFQHVFAPFIPDVRFIVYRMVMFFPFAVLVAIVMRTRPRFMPYMGIIHILMDLSIAVMFLLNHI